jgi:peptidoglycan/xylan/chitin deacetylase (PgdA/CDA1 family)
MQTDKEPVTSFSRASFVAALAAVLFPADSALAQDRVTCGQDKLGVSREIAVDGGEKLSLGLQSYPRTLDLADHEVVLTFDDGPAATTTQVLDALKSECAKATFFIIGHNAEAMPQVVRREVEEGHSIGYHSNTHPERTLRLMTVEAAKADIDAGVAAVDKAGFAAAGDRPKSVFFRFPGFADTPSLLDHVHGRGLAVFGSDLWASDWRKMTPQEELKLVMERLEKTGRGIVLFHDSKASTAKMLPDFLRALKEKGFRLVHMKPGVGPTPVTAAQPGWTSTTEPIVRKVLSEKGEAEPKAHDGGGM